MTSDLQKLSYLADVHEDNTYLNYSGMNTVDHRTVRPFSRKKLHPLI